MPSPAAIQLGAFAACIVLFVPMSLAGYHLSRNKMLFFSGSLFITLALFVHLSPYIPSLFHHSYSPCLLHSLTFPSSTSFSFSPQCHLHKLSPPDASDLLNGSHIIIAGDSQARLFTLSLFNLILDSHSMAQIKLDLFKRHSDYSILIHNLGITVDFLWAPYEANVTSMNLKLLADPDIYIAASGLWHMLHVNNASDYSDGLRNVSRSAVGSHLFWMGMPTLVEEKLNTAEKRERMGRRVQEEYGRAVDESGILRRFLLLGIGFLSGSCGEGCTVDGMHYGEVVYDAAVQIMLNALLIESQQQI